MTRINNRSHAFLGTALAALALSVGPIAVAAPAAAQPRTGTFKPTSQVLLSTGEGQMVSLPSSVVDVWTSNPEVADVYVTSPRRLNLFGKTAGEATIIATGANGQVVYATNVRVSQNITSVDEVLRAAMPNSNIRVINAGQVAVLTGTVASPDEAAQAYQLVASVLNPGVDMSKENASCKICVVNRLSTATPLQVNLKVKIVEVNRSLVRNIGVNLLSQDNTGGFQFGVGQGNPGTIGAGGKTFNVTGAGTTLGFAGKLLGLDLLSTINLAENDGLVTTLAEPNLTALSGETASFLAGGEFPIPVSQGNDSLSVEYKQYGVGLAFTPIVLADGRISMRVRPEVSELSNEGSIKLGGYDVPALTTRRAETTVELGSGQSFMIAGLLRNTNTNSIQKAPFLGDIPILGTLFRSTSYRRAETELVIIVTPYLVRPMSGPAVLPSKGYRAPSATDMLLEGKSYGTVPVPPQPVASAAPAGGGVAAPGFKM